MKTLKLAAWALIAVVATEIPAQAAWNNVFQPTLFGRRSTSNYCCPTPAPVIARVAPACNGCAPVVAPAPCNTCFSPPPAAPCAPACQTCTTCYVQRAYYEPVTTMQSYSYYEPVTTYQTSYYQEAVTSYQTSYYPDPCSCGYIAKSCPVTTYQLRAKTCPVQSWVQRCAQQPVTSFRVAYKLEPQTTCTSSPAPVVAMAPAPAPAPCCQQPAAPAAPPAAQPPIIQQAPPAGPQVGGAAYRMSYTQTTSNWKPVVNLGAIQPEDQVQGQVVRQNRTPTANTQVLFVNATTGQRHSITTNDAGRFNLALSSGNYHVFLAGGNGSPAYHSQVNVERNQANVVNLIN